MFIVTERVPLTILLQCNQCKAPNVQKAKNPKQQQQHTHHTLTYKTAKK